MSLRPRYSLLTLLILTALVAGGVKLWYGPHHVVERPKPGLELEYTYIRDWHGATIIDGPYVGRTLNEPFITMIWTYRQGRLEDLSCDIHTDLYPDDKQRTAEFYVSDFSAADQQFFSPLIKQEIQRFIDLNKKWSIAWSWNFTPQSFVREYP